MGCDLESRAVEIELYINAAFSRHKCVPVESLQWIYLMNAFSRDKYLK